MYVWALVLDDVPPLLSLGLLVLRDGFRYVWDQAQPYLEHKVNRKRIKCDLQANCPVIFQGTDANEQVQANLNSSENTVEPPVEGSTPTPDAGAESMKKEELKFKAQKRLRKKRKAPEPADQFLKDI